MNVVCRRNTKPSKNQRQTGEGKSSPPPVNYTAAPFRAVPIPTRTSPRGSVADLEYFVSQSRKFWQHCPIKDCGNLCLWLYRSRFRVVTNIGIVTNVSVNINNGLTPLSTSTTGPDVASLGQFTVIVNNRSADITAMQATAPFTVQADCDAIVVALDSFVEVHQALLTTVIGKHAIFAQFAVTASIAAVLRILEAIIDSFAFAMIDLIPCGAGSVTNDKNGLDTSFGNSITLYTESSAATHPRLGTSILSSAHSAAVRHTVAIIGASQTALQILDPHGTGNPAHCVKRSNCDAELQMNSPPSMHPASYK
ncbi:hypothetical protein DFH08DRAFT_820302 [Mycena albidolilacea]|uniref:Uncharacterized protein n=1 Tax=Mycena albidolilacea TaxID=1033008 RepID=A0AAD7EF89_9AGAR|nr:hypothetical protein DFH08DRAFT_820302 [Mycena albidolilacea]